MVNYQGRAANRKLRSQMGSEKPGIRKTNASTLSSTGVGFRSLIRWFDFAIVKRQKQLAARSYDRK
ncbi:hypothetical protein SAMN03080617_03343 [Algoriphagus alkaliphilus]|uniref:Uncharacterized protein n=1 Tax=Algoriphagus alkaliphilus TaxID=279824 RepID=A0A1G5Z7Y0_9BACT|nr:hypothetical protein [Algoriphagus alkaliphilus]MBA4299555.1 hypothetical protein [Cyclobacterium sp.]SDA90864.1 hypothetical protein SAMN03080617_03343 [Algoriphagus alkaliphilus]